MNDGTAPLTLKAYLHRPYLDLGPVGDAPLHARGVDVTYSRLGEQRDYVIWVQRQMSAHFRESVVAETGLAQYRVTSPLDLSTDLRTSRWDRLCGYTEAWHALAPQEKVQVARVLLALCFTGYLLRLVPSGGEESAREDENRAQLVSVRATARIANQLDRRGTLDGYEPDDLIALVETAPEWSHARLNALLHLIVQFARDRKNAQAAAHWSEVAKDALHRIERSDGDGFATRHAWSRYYRAAALEPKTAGDRRRTVEMMNLAEEYARALPRDTSEQTFFADENMYSLLESRAKEALWIGDLNLAETRGRELVALAPADSKALIELGEVLVQREKFEEAERIYRNAARYGPPGTAIAWFMAGQCCEEKGALELAWECYMAALEADPFSTSALERLQDIARAVGDDLLGRWASERLEAGESSVGTGTLLQTG